MPDTRDKDSVLLHDFIRDRAPVLVLTGAGCSTDSGIPDYRDDNGRWKSAPPILYQDFVRHHAVRQRYWARSFVGWPLIRAAHPNTAHRVLAELEAGGWVHSVITQNVDGLHQKAGSCNLVELHGNLQDVVCMQCAQREPRSRIQQRLQEMNESIRIPSARAAPDGDARLDDEHCKNFRVPDCKQCGGPLKPDVVFFGENVPRQKIQSARMRLHDSRGMLVIGSSLMVYSGYRFIREARKASIPMALINLGVTRADDEVPLKFCRPAANILVQLQRLLHDSLAGTPARTGIPM